MLFEFEFGLMFGVRFTFDEDVPGRAAAIELDASVVAVVAVGEVGELSVEEGHTKREEVSTSGSRRRPETHIRAKASNLVTPQKKKKLKKRGDQHFVIKRKLPKRHQKKAHT